MTRRLFATFFLAAFVLTGTAMAQSGGGDAPPPPGDGQGGMRQGVLRDLGLSNEQFESIRRINRERRGLMTAAQERLRNANRNLDDAIYSDDASEELINQRMAEVQSAQGEVLRVRSMTEFQIRKVLSPQQLKIFRDARRRMGDGPGPGPGGRRPDNRPGPGREPARRPGGGQRPPSNF